MPGSFLRKLMQSKIQHPVSSIQHQHPAPSIQNPVSSLKSQTLYIPWILPTLPQPLNRSLNSFFSCFFTFSSHDPLDVFFFIGKRKCIEKLNCFFIFL